MKNMSKLLIPIPRKIYNDKTAGTDAQYAPIKGMAPKRAAITRKKIRLNY